LAEDRSSATLSFVVGRDDPLVGQLADASRLTHQGPEIAAISGDDRGLVAQDLHTDGRWPAYAEIIAQLPVAAALGVPLRVGDERLGVLALYSERPGAFGNDAVEMLGVYAHHAALIVSRLAARHTAQHLSTALATNRRISIAIGILMIRSKLTEDEAFDRLRRTSQRLHSKLRDVADYVALTGELPDNQV
jgi:GAF domain-containing protein